MRTVRTSVTALGLLLLMAASSSAQSFEEKLEEKLKEPFVSKAAWVLDYADALKKAKEEKKIVFAYFTRSYAPWPPCKQVEGGAFDTPEFTEFSKQVVPFMHVTTRIEGRKDEGLLGEKGGRGFPYIVFMDEEGSVLAQQGERTVAGFDATLKKLQRLFDLRAKARGGDAAAEIEVALLEGDLEIAAFDDVKRRLDGKKLTEAQVGLLSDLELSAMIGAVQNATDEAGARAAAKTVADAFAAGRKPLGKDKLRPFYFILLQYAHGERNPDLAQKALDAIKPIFKEAMGDDPRLDEWLRKQQDAIDELRAPPEEEEGCGEDEGMEEGCGED